MPPLATRGIWGEPTSTLDWCEQNYEVTRYVAEFWNTITNGVMICTGLKGLYDVHTQGFEKRFHLCFASLLIVGLGSWLFHMTLRYEMQLLDELPMVWGGSILAYCMYQVRTPPNQTNIWLATTLAVTCFAYTAIYLVWKHPVIHFFAYGCIVASLVVLDFNVMRWQYNVSVFKCYVLGFILQMLGVIVWNIDTLACPQIETIRQKMPAALAPLSQLHGWWHIFAGYATYLHILSCICHRQIYLKRKYHFVPDPIVGCSIITTKHD